MVWAEYPPKPKAGDEDDECSLDYSVETSVTTGKDDNMVDHLSWRMDPTESFSDWTVEIQVRNNASSTVEAYHIHRAIVAFGPRKSGYFANLFRYAIDDRCARFELTDKAATFFPDLLDYLYSSASFKISTVNAVALGFLSQCFMVPSLQKQVEDFILQDLKFSNVGTYMSDAVHFKDEGTSSRAMDKCVEEIMMFCTNSKVSEKIFTFPHSHPDKKEYQNVWRFLTKFPHVAGAKVRQDFYRIRDGKKS